jgi:hypothetical protein
MDRFATKFAYQSPYLFAGNTPISGGDINGDSLYILTYIRGSENGEKSDGFEAGARTRQLDIENSTVFDKKRDKVIVIEIKSLSEVQTQVESTVNTYSGKYGQTAEFGMWSHSGSEDGPVGGGDVTNVDDALSSDASQMLFSGWEKINFNWECGARATFYGCNTAGTGGSWVDKSWTDKLSELPNFKDIPVYGQSTWSYPSQYTDERNISWSDFLPVTEDNKTYWVGSKVDQGGSALFGGADVVPMKKSVNGSTVKRDVIQPGDKSE